MPFGFHFAQIYLAVDQDMSGMFILATCYSVTRVDMLQCD
jgi:hypothetical protein